MVAVKVQPNTPMEPSSIGALELLSTLSVGGMGRVMLARRRGAHGFEKLFAVKLMNEALGANSEARAMFLDEARLAARLSHSGITQVIDFGEEAGRLFLVMEYVAGVDLAELVRVVGPALPPLAAIRMIAESARALHAAHEATDEWGISLGVVHRDVTPRNLMLTFEGQMKILDFGIAYMRQRSIRETQIGQFKGRPTYMAPEQYASQPVDRRTDLYSISVVLHELLTGKPLFSGDSIPVIANQVLTGVIVPPSALVAGLPPGVDGVVMRGLSRSPEDRYPDAQAFADELDAIWTMNGGPSLRSFAEERLASKKVSHDERTKSLRSSLLPGAPKLTPQLGAFERLMSWFKTIFAAPPAPSRPAIAPTETQERVMTPLPPTRVPETTAKTKPVIEVFVSPIHETILAKISELTPRLKSDPGTLVLLSDLRRALKNDGISLPSLPEGLVRVQQLLGDPDADLSRLAQAIEQEPATALRFMQAANSAFYGDGRVNGIKEAVVRLGLRRSAMITMAIVAKSKLFAVHAGDKVGARLFEESLAAAVSGQVLARRVDSRSEQDAFLCGLLHNLGRVCVRDLAASVRRRSRGRDVPTEEGVAMVEDALYALVGALIAHSAGFDAAVVEAIRTQPHDAEANPSDTQLSQILVASRALAHHLVESGGTDETPADAIEAALQLGLEDVEEVIWDARESLNGYLF